MALSHLYAARPSQVSVDLVSSLADVLAGLSRVIHKMVSVLLDVLAALSHLLFKTDSLLMDVFFLTLAGKLSNRTPS